MMDCSACDAAYSAILYDPKLVENGVREGEAEATFQRTRSKYQIAGFLSIAIVIIDFVDRVHLRTRLGLSC